MPHKKSTSQATSTTAAIGTEFFPPYGPMHAGLRAAIQRFPIPVGYEAPPGKPLPQAWKDKYNGLLTRMSDTFWPRWDTTAAGGPSWAGKARTDMAALTDADFKLLPALMQLIDSPVVQRAAGSGALPSATPHVEYFRREDGSPEPWPAMEYLTMDDRTSLASAATRVGVGPFIGRLGFFQQAHCTAPTLPMKDAIQRPRPYQLSSLRGQAFSYLYGPGAVTSALPSGHAIQGVMSVCGALMELWDAFQPTPALLARLSQYAVDVGDRRVMAGVHYPSDNLASWCVALSLCDELYGANAKAARQFLVGAIRDHSVVFRAIVDSRDAAYQTKLAWFDELAGAAA